MRHTVTLKVVREATVVVDMDKEEVESVEWVPLADVAATAQATFIPNSVGEEAAREILKRRPWMLR